MPKLQTCDFGWTGLCIFESSLCTTNLSKSLNLCKKEDIEASNRANHNPVPDDDKYEKFVTTKKEKTIRYIIIGVVVCIIIYILYHCCCCCYIISNGKQINVV